MSQESNIHLIDSIGNEDLYSICRDLGEVGLDMAFDDGVIREIPVFNTLFSLNKVRVRIEHYFFVKKVTNFLGKLSNIPFEDRRKFVEQMAKIDKIEI